jgi:hypothetical protein
MIRQWKKIKFYAIGENLMMTFSGGNMQFSIKNTRKTVEGTWKRYSDNGVKINKQKTGILRYRIQH